MPVFNLPSAPLRSKLLWLLISGIIIVLVLLLAQHRTLRITDDLLQDFIIASQQHPLSDKIVIVAIDDDSIAMFGRWPWRRSLHAELIKRISEQAPAAIGLDILFSEADLQHPEDDQLLAAAIRESGVVTLPVIFTDNGQLRYIQKPHPLLAEHAASLGHVHIKVDYDGIVRAVDMQRDHGRHYPHFSQALLETASDIDSAHLHQADEAEQLIPYAGKAGYFPRIPYQDVIEGKIGSDTFTDKLVLVGATATGIGDQYATPVSDAGQLMPGVEILANILESKLSGRSLTTASTGQNIIFNLAFVCIALLGFMVLSPLGALLLSFFLFALLLLSTYLITICHGLLISPSSGGLGLLLVYPLWSWHRLNTAARFLATEFESFKHEFPMLATPKGTAFNDFLDKRITALHEATHQLQSMHRFISDSVNGLPDPTVICDPHGIIRIANQAAAHYFEAGVAVELVQQPLIPLLQNIRDNRENQIVIDTDVLQAETEIEVEARDHKRRELLVKLVPCKDASAQHIGWILSIIDITKLWQAERDRDEAFRFITHDIRAPLSSIISLVELQKLTPDSMDERWLGMIEKHADNALTLADDFVQLTRAKSGHYQPSDLNLVDLLHETIDDAWALAHTRGITITLATAPAEAHVCVDRTLFKRAIANLLSNAIKFSPDHASIGCSIALDHPYWDLSIQDAGIGITPEAQHQLFQSFSRVHQQSHPHIEGTGLGLAFVHAVAMRHQGTVSVESILGKGSTFHLRVPMPI